MREWFKQYLKTNHQDIFRIFPSGGSNIGYAEKGEMQVLEKDKFQTWWALFKLKRTENNNIKGFELDTRRNRNIWFKKK